MRTLLVLALIQLGCDGTQGEAGQQGSQGPQGPPGPQGEPGPPTGPTVKWIDGAGNVVAGLYGPPSDLSYFDANGNVWGMHNDLDGDVVIDPKSSNLAARIYPTTDCTGPVYFGPPIKIARITFPVAFTNEIRVLKDTAHSILFPMSSHSQTQEDGSCVQFSGVRYGFPEADTMVVTVPTVVIPPPLHPVLVQ